MSDNIDVLVIDAASGADQFWQEVLQPTQRETFRAQRVDSFDDANAALKQTPFDVIIVDVAFNERRGTFPTLHGATPVLAPARYIFQENPQKK